jgi:transcription initiation factor IIE alpha subunit
MPKLDVLAYVEERGEVTSVDLAEAFGWTLPGAASTLLRLHRQGHLRRRWRGRREDRRGGAVGFVYRLSDKGSGRLPWEERQESSQG